MEAMAAGRGRFNHAWIDSFQVDAQFQHLSQAMRSFGQGHLILQLLREADVAQQASGVTVQSLRFVVLICVRTNIEGVLFVQQRPHALLDFRPTVDHDRIEAGEEGGSPGCIHPQRAL